jgi:hypothetical protein
MMVGRITEAGIDGIDDTEAEVVEGSVDEVLLVICGGVEVDREEAGCTDVMSMGPRDCVEEGSTLTVGVDAVSSAS